MLQRYSRRCRYLYIYVDMYSLMRWAGRGAVVDRGQRVEAPIAPRHRLRLQKLTSDLPIVRQVVVAHLLLLVPAIVLLPHRPPVVTHLEKELISHVLFSKSD